MIKARFEEPTTGVWRRWKEKTLSATAQLVADFAKGDRPEIDARLYREVKATVLGAFHGKCAYCESRISADQPGDVDHFRPKSSITDEAGDVVTVSHDGKEVPHPGYYWLAYDPANLLPSCNRCNRPGKDGAGGIVGKWNRFPVKGFRARVPGEEKDEEPLLINPLLTDPASHFVIDATGIVGAVTLEGATCLRVLGLNRDGLVDERRKTYLQVQGTLALLGSAAIAGGEMLEHIRLLREYRHGKQPYALAARSALREYLPRLHALVDELSH